MSMDCLRTKEYPTIGKTQYIGYKLKSHNTPVEFTSFRQLANMLTPLVRNKLPLAVDGTPNSFNFSLGANLSPTTTDFMAVNALITVMSAFRYWRGGWRAVVASLEPALMTTAALELQIHAFGLIYGTDADMNGGTYNSIPTKDVMNGWFYSPQNSTTPVDVIVPWFSRYNCATSKIDIPPIWEVPWDGYKLIVVYQTKPTDYRLPVHLMIGAADDFLAGYQLGVPWATFTTTGPVDPVPVRKRRDIQIPLPLSLSTSEADDSE